MNYLARITVGKSQAAKLKMGDAYAWHRKLWDAFPDRDGMARDFLFRVDDAETDFKTFLLSATRPIEPTWGHWEVKSVSESFLTHECYRFQIKTNPTMRRNRDGRRLGIYAEGKLREWLHRKAEQNGFDVQDENLIVGAPIEETFLKKGMRGKHVAVDFQGTLRVVERTAFIQAFENGIGSAKAFGFGMLMLQSVGQNQ
jgi:CRISPR system Cascade subunit CasE